MRNIHLTGGLCLLLLLHVPAMAQTADSAVSGSTTTKTTTTTEKAATITEVQTLAPDALVMSSGSILVVRGNQKSRLETELRLTDGSILTPGGTVRRPDGSSASLNDGQAISAAGKIAPTTNTTTVVTESNGTTIQVSPTAK